MSNPAESALSPYISNLPQTEPYWPGILFVVPVLMFKHEHDFRAVGTLTTIDKWHEYDWDKVPFTHQYPTDLHSGEAFRRYAKIPGRFEVACVTVVHVDDTAYAFYIVVEGRADVRRELHGLNLTHGRVGDFCTRDDVKIHMGPVAKVLLG